MVLLSSRLMFVYEQVPILQVKSQTATMFNNNIKTKPVLLLA